MKALFKPFSQKWCIPTRASFFSITSYFGTVGRVSFQSRYIIQVILQLDLPLTALAASCAFTLGGIRIESLSVVWVRRTFPAAERLGKPSAPVTVRAGLQFRLRSNSNRFWDTGPDS